MKDVGRVVLFIFEILSLIVGGVAGLISKLFGLIETGCTKLKDWCFVKRDKLEHPERYIELVVRSVS